MVQKMLFVNEDKSVCAKYNSIWNKIKNLFKVKFTVDPVRNNKYLLAKLKIFNGVNRTTFTNASTASRANVMSDDQIPVEKNGYICIPCIDIDSILQTDKKVYSQAFLEQCKYKLKKRRPVNLIDLDIISEGSESESESESEGID